MNTQATPSNTAHPDSELWYLKTGNGEVFGPVKLPALQRWAAAGRVTPDALLSPDQNQWSPAYLLDALAMTCVVRVRPGVFYGPVHANAVDIYQRDGVIPRNVAVYIARPAGPLPGLDEINRQIETLEAATREALANSEHRHLASLRRAEEQLGQTSAANSALRQSNESLSAELDQLRGRLASTAQVIAENETLRKSNESLAYGLEQLRGQLAAATQSRAETEALRRANEALDAEIAQLREKLAAASAQSLADSENLRKANEALAAEITILREKLAANASAAADNENLRKANEALNTGLGILREKLAAATAQAVAENESLRKSNESLLAEIEMLRDKQADTTRSLAENEATLAQFHETVGSLTGKLHRLINEYSKPVLPGLENEPPAPAIPAAGMDALPAAPRLEPLPAPRFEEPPREETPPPPFEEKIPEPRMDEPPVTSATAALPVPEAEAEAEADSDERAPAPIAPITPEVAFDPAESDADSPMARFEAQARAELAKLKTTPSFAKFFKSSK